MATGADSAAILAKLFSQGGGGADALQLRDLQEGRLGELEDQIAGDRSVPDTLTTDRTGRVQATPDPVSAASILRRGLFKKSLESDLANDPDTGLAAHQQVAQSLDDNNKAAEFFDPMQERMRQAGENFQLRKATAEHPNPNVMPFGNGVAGGNGNPEAPMTGGRGGGGMVPVLEAPKGVDPNKWAQATAGMNPETAAKLAGMLDYSLPIPNGNVLARPEYSTLVGYAKMLDPTFDSKMFDTRKAYMKDYASGQTGRAITSLDTVMHHLDTFNTSADALHNTGAPSYNAFANWFKEKTVGFPEKKSFDDAAGAVEGELANVFKATGATDQEIHAWRSHLASSETPDEFKANVKALVTLINGRMQAVGNRYKSVMGHDAPDFLSPESRAIFNRFSGGSPQAAAPGGGMNPPMAGGAGNGVTVRRIQ